MPSLRGAGAAVAAAVLCLTSASVAIAEPEAGETTAETTTTEPAPTEQAPPTGPPEKPEAPEEPPAADTNAVFDFEVNVAFDKASYSTGEDMRITVSVKNNGADDTVSAWSFTTDPDNIRVGDWGDLNGKVALPAGQTLTRTVTGSVANPEVTTGHFELLISDSTGAGRLFEHSVPVTPRFAQAEGTVYHDRDSDARFDSGEGLGGVTLTWQSQVDYELTFTTTTGADGTYAFEVPTGDYFVSGAAPDGLLVGYRVVTVDEDGVDGTLFRATPPITGLDVGLEFTKDVYAKDEAPVVRVTLTNTGDLPLTGLVAYCNRVGNSDGMNGTGPGWGDLAFDFNGKGVTVAANSTLRLEVTEPMPSGAYNRGSVFVACDFGYVGVDDASNPDASDVAAVPGMRGAIEGSVQDGETGLAGVRVVLVSDAQCPITAEGTTDAAGEFRFTDVPVGEYDLYLFTPAGWRVEHDNPSRAQLYGAGPARVGIEVEPGEATPPTLPDCSAAPTTTTAAPAPQGGAAPKTNLASTGASIAGPGIIGLLALLAGVGAVVVARRKTA